MLKGQSDELENRKSSPFSVLLSIYNAKLAPMMPGWEKLDYLQQCQYLALEGIATKQKRQECVRTLMEKQSLQELKQKSYLRIRIKYTLRQYHGEAVSLLQNPLVTEWGPHQIMVSFVTHLFRKVGTDENKVVLNEKVWAFTEYLRLYLFETNYDGKEFLNAVDPKSKDGKKQKGFGLQMMKNVCTRFDLKSGPFSKAKKECNLWAQALLQTYHERKEQNEPLPVPPSKPKKTYSKFVTQIPEHQMVTVPANPPKKKAAFIVPAANLWYWFNDMNNKFEWVPYREEDVRKLTTAWNKNEDACMVVGGRFRVQFDRSQPNMAQGNQYSNAAPDAAGRVVTCSSKTSSIHSIPTAQNPL